MDECKPLPPTPARLPLMTLPVKLAVDLSVMQGLTLIHFSAQREPFLSLKRYPKHPLKHPLGLKSPVNMTS